MLEQYNSYLIQLSKTINHTLHNFLLFSGKISFAHFEGYTLSEKLQPLDFGLSIKIFIGMNSFAAYRLRYALSSK
jgi:hypothetical protein